MSNLQVFKFEDTKNIRTVLKNSSPWFVAKDLCNVLEVGNVTDALKRLEDEEKGFDLIDTLGGPQRMAIVNESGMYALVVTSRKPSAVSFRKWVTSEVLPSIRQTGRYDGDLLTTAKMFLRMAEEVTGLKDRVEVLEDKVFSPPSLPMPVAAKEKQLVAVAKSEVSHLSITDYADSLGISLSAGKVRGAGRTATSISKKLGYVVYHKENSKVGLYRADVLSATFTRNGIKK